MGVDQRWGRTTDSSHGLLINSLTFMIIRSCTPDIYDRLTPFTAGLGVDDLQISHLDNGSRVVELVFQRYVPLLIILI